MTELFLPRRTIEDTRLPSYVKLDMAFGVGAGTYLRDKSRYWSHGAITGAAWATGAHGKCLEFNPATPSYIEIDAGYDQLDFTSEKFSIVSRVYLDDLSDRRIIICRGIYNTDGWNYFFHNIKSLVLRTYQSGAYQQTTTAAASISTGVWYTAGMSRDGASVKLYLNGVDSNSVVGTHVNPATSSRSAKIGIYDNKSNYPFDGKMEFLRIFGGVALSASEHLAWHNALA